MALFLDIIRSHPFLSIALILGPFIGGLVGAGLGYDNLKGRVARERQQLRQEQALNQLTIPIDVLRRYEAALSQQGQGIEVLRRILSQYEQLRAAVQERERFIGRAITEDRIAAAEHILAQLEALLGNTQTAPGPGGQALIIKTGANTFRVIFSVPMRIAPNLTFRGLPPGVESHVLEKTNIGFTVTFTPATIPVETFGFVADAEL